MTCFYYRLNAVILCELKRSSLKLLYEFSGAHAWFSTSSNWVLIWSHSWFSATDDVHRVYQRYQFHINMVIYAITLWIIRIISYISDADYD